MPEFPNTDSILILSGVKGDTRRYRAFHPYEQLRLAGVGSTLSHLTDPKLPAAIQQAHLVIFHRVAWDPFVAGLFAEVSQCGALAIADVDDLLFDPSAFHWIDSPDFQDPVRAQLYREEMHRHRLTLEACQAVIASTGYLAGQVRLTGKPAWVHRNGFSSEMLELAEAAYCNRKANEHSVIIGYASGTPTHGRDFAVIKPALQRILQQYPQTELWLIGPLNPGKDWGSLAGRVRQIPLVPWRKLPEYLVQLDINLAPLLLDNPFSQSKSEIKYMEAALVRVPTIASPTDAFKYPIHSGENGFLAANVSEWIETLSNLVEGADVRQQIGERAYADVVTRYHPARRAEELLATLEEILQTSPEASPGHLPLSIQPESQGSGSAEVSTTFRIDPAFERDPTLLRSGLYSLRHRGLGTLLKQVWVYLRRLLAPIFPFKSG
jgi:glycosyltransferase involved in cell wall biosynthesis